jgi:hypothetical protein
MTNKILEKLNKHWLALSFITIEFILWMIILFVDLPFELHFDSYLAILICLIFVIIHFKDTFDYKIMLLAFIFTASADFFLTLLSTQQILGTFLFFLSQLMFMFRLHVTDAKVNYQALIPYAVGFVVISMSIVFFLQTYDLLLLVSVLYYAFLLINTFYAWKKKDKYILFAIALTLYLLADTMVGLKASSPYITFNPHTFFYWLTHISFNLIWLFYLPTQVLFALSIKYNKLQQGV